MHYKRKIILGLALCMAMGVGCSKQTEKHTAVENGIVGEENEMAVEQETQVEETAEAPIAADGAKEQQETEKSEGTGAKIFAKLDGKMTSAGILFDEEQTMYVAIDKGLFKITPDGNVSPFCSFEDSPSTRNYCYPSPTIWDMTFDKEHNILAAAQDRILKISSAGEVTILVEEAFSGFLGTSGITCDDMGNIYFTNGSRIEKMTPELERSTFIDGSEAGYKGFFSLAFDPQKKNLYVSEWYTKLLLKYPLDEEGNVCSTPTVIVDNPLESKQWNFGSPLNITFSESETMYVSMDGFSKIMKMTPEGEISYLELGKDAINHIIAFGGKGFNEESIYMTTLMGEAVYEFPVGEKVFK